jgi:hypothetical protein
MTKYKCTTQLFRRSASEADRERGRGIELLLERTSQRSYDAKNPLTYSEIEVYAMQASKILVSEYRHP